MGWFETVRPDAETCVLVEDGDVIVQIYEDAATAVLTVRNPHSEGKATVRLTAVQAGILSDVLQKVPPRDMEL